MDNIFIYYLDNFVIRMFNIFSLTEAYLRSTKTKPSKGRINAIHLAD